MSAFNTNRVKCLDNKSLITDPFNSERTIKHKTRTSTLLNLEQHLPSLKFIKLSRVEASISGLDSKGNQRQRSTYVKKLYLKFKN